MDDSRASKHIIVADFSIVNDVFIAVAYHTDLMIFRMMYDNETEMITSMMGPFGKTPEKFPITDIRLIEYLGHEKYKPDWIPLLDDGDALRLAVKLRLEVSVWDTDTTVLTSDDEILTLIEPANGDPLAATRRAITRAAAETGRNMK